MKHLFADLKTSTPPVLILVTMSILFASLLSTLPGLAQTVTTNITPTTGAFSLETIVLPTAGNVYNINGGTVKVGPTGSNLFHSFGDFNLAAGNIASFNNTTGVTNIANILSRVTGENPSYLFGTMRSTIDGANFFFLNPHGVIFGPEAHLDMSGAAYFTTANHISLTDGVKFDMAATAAVLTNAPVASFGFLGPDAASIFVQGSTLTVAEGQTLALIGGDRQFFGPEGERVPSGVTVSGGTLSAPSGQVHLVSVASAGNVTMPAEGLPGLGVETFSRLGKVDLSNGALLNASTLTDIDGIPLSTNGGGTVSIRAGQFVMNSSSITSNTLSLGDGAATAVSIQTSGDITITNGSSIWSYPCFAFPCGIGRTGDMQISGQKVLIENGSLIKSSTATEVPTVTSEIINPVGGNISFIASELKVMSGSLVDTESFGLGDGGTISIRATDHVKIAGFDPLFGTASQVGTFVTSEMGKGGTIEIWSPKITVEDLGSLNTFAGSRRSGALSLHVDELTVSRGGQIGSQGGDLSIQGFTLADARDVSLFGYGQGNRESRIDMIGGGATEGGEDTGAGTLSIKTTRLSLTDDARINSEANTLSGGLITIGATESVAVENGAKIRVSGGNGGSLEITAPTILLDRGSFQTTSGPGLVSGPVTIKTRSLTLQNGGQINSGASAFAGPTEGGGGVTVQGSQGPGSGADSILITGRDSAGNPSGITTATSQSLPGGDIALSARTVTLQNGGTLNSTTAGTTLGAVGGNITISSSQSVQLSNGAHISASSTGAGKAGSIMINAGQQLEMRDSSIKTEAAHASGGNIDIQAIDRVRLVNSTISTSVLGGSGGGGNITIDPNVVVLQNSQIIAQAVQGTGGNITITTPLFLADQTSLVSASSQFGLNGTVTIQSPTSNLSESVGSLPSSMHEQQALQTQRCAALSGGESSSFVIAGRDTIPTEPGGWLTSPLGLDSLGRGLFGETTIDEQRPTTLVMAQTSEAISLRRLTPAGFLTQRFAGNGSDGCRS